MLPHGVVVAPEPLDQDLQLGGRWCRFLLVQKVPEGYYHLDRMIASVARHGGEIGCCGTCLDARGMDEERLAKGAHRSSLEELTSWTLWADKVVSF